jgi:uncharacterized coiled-coil DUF342 family protein
MKRAEDFVKMVLKCAKRMGRLIKEWEELFIEIEKIEKEKEQLEKLLPLIGESKSACLLNEVQALAYKASEFRRKISKMINPFDRLGE